MKTCLRCHVPKSLDEFGTYNRYPDGKSRYCRACYNASVKAKRHERGTKSIPPFLERLWGNIQQCGHEETCVYCCWPWQKSLDQDGYGKFTLTYAGRHLTIPVTRVVYEVWHGVRIPPGLLVCHYCDARACANPLHLWLGTLNDNRQDCVRKGRQARGLMAGVHTMPEAFPHGEQHHKAKLQEADVYMIRTLYSQGQIGAQRLGTMYDVSKFAILCIIHRRTWKHI
jgi:hypothetical protein